MLSNAAEKSTKKKQNKIAKILAKKLERGEVGESIKRKVLEVYCEKEKG